MNLSRLPMTPSRSVANICRPLGRTVSWNRCPAARCSSARTIICLVASLAASLWHRARAVGGTPVLEILSIEADVPEDGYARVQIAVDGAPPNSFVQVAMRERLALDTRAAFERFPGDELASTVPLHHGGSHVLSVDLLVDVLLHYSSVTMPSAEPRRIAAVLSHPRLGALRVASIPYAAGPAASAVADAPVIHERVVARVVPVLHRHLALRATFPPVPPARVVRSAVPRMWPWEPWPYDAARGSASECSVFGRARARLGIALPQLGAAARDVSLPEPWQELLSEHAPPGFRHLERGHGER